MLNKLQNKLV